MADAPQRPSQPELSATFRRLKHAAPAEFDEVLKQFASYTTDCCVAVTEAPTEEVLRIQGHAQMARALLRLLRECDPRP
jgi:hypothetical protein